MKRAPGKSPSGRFVLRIPPSLHAALREEARETGLSLNDLCVRKLALPSGKVVPGLSEAVERALRLFGARLLGVAAFGSWARGELLESSDVDLLVVLDRSIRLTRGLYRRWDEEPLELEARPIEPHFVHLPQANRTVAGIWAEVALDGIVLFERSLELSARLVRVRRDIVSGRIVRKLVHGQPYWAEVA